MKTFLSLVTIFQKSQNIIIRKRMEKVHEKFDSFNYL